MKIYVSGGVNKEGVYFVQTGAGVLDAIKAADGFRDDAMSVELFRGVKNGYARHFAHFRVKAIRDNTANEVLMDRDQIVVEEYNGGRF